MYFVLVWCMVEVVCGVVSSMHRVMAQTKTQNDVDLSGQAVWVVDLFSRVYQLFHALPEMSSPEGTPVSVVFGLTRDLIDIIEKKKPDYLFCASDTPEQTFRHKQFEAYKATRSEMPADLVPQIPLVKKLLEVFGVPCLELAGYEADDVLATVSVQTVSAGGECTLVTSDKDARQLLGPHVRLLNLRNNAFVEFTYGDDVRAMEPSAGRGDVFSAQPAGTWSSSI